MPGTNAGTGYPLTLRCAKCKRHRDYRRDHWKGTNLVATGKVKKSTGSTTWRRQHAAEFLVGYRCLDCGWEGWTKHPEGYRLLNIRRGHADEWDKAMEWARWRVRGLGVAIDRDGTPPVSEGILRVWVGPAMVALRYSRRLAEAEAARVTTRHRNWVRGLR